MFLLFIIALIASFVLAEFYPGSTWKPESSFMDGIIYKEVWNKDNQMVFEPYGAGVRILITNINTKDLNSKEVIVKGRLEQPESCRNPGGFDYRKYLYGKNIKFTINNPEIQVKDSAFSLRSTGSVIRQHIDKALGEVLGNNFKGFVMGVMTGDTSFLDAEEKQWIRLSGISHIMAVSGTHVTYILLPVKRLLRRKKLDISIRSFLCLFPLFFFVMTAGFTPSVVRAGVMCAMDLISKITERRNDSLNSLGVAGIVCLIMNPFASCDTGFLLSFGAVLSGRVITPTLKKFIYRHREPIKYLDSLIYGLAVNIGFLPLMMYLFNMISPAGVIITLVAAPLSALMCILGYGSVVLFYLPFGGILAEFFGVILTGISGFLETISKLGAYIPIVNTTSPGIYFFIIYYGIIGIVCLNVKCKKILLFLILSVCIFPVHSNNFNLRISWLDVGQGSCVLIETEKSGKILIDGGNGYTDVSNLLFKQGVGYIDYVILSHGDSDHVEGLYDVVKEHSVGTVFIPENTNDQGACDLAELCNSKQVSVKRISGKYSFYVDDLLVELLCFIDDSSLNNSSIVVQLTKDNRSFLFPGDLETDGEETLMSQNFLRECFVVTASHHGSKSGTGEPLLSATNPTAGVISVGERNRYGHPAEEVLNRFYHQGTYLFRTDQDGAVILTIKDKGNPVFETWLKRENIIFKK